jgi:hypothetical protein
MAWRSCRCQQFSGNHAVRVAGDDMEFGSNVPPR